MIKYKVDNKENLVNILETFTKDNQCYVEYEILNPINSSDFPKSYPYFIILSLDITSNNKYGYVSYEIIVESDFEGAMFKFNHGNNVLLCSNCSKILKNHHVFTENEWKAVRGEIYMDKQYCDKCKPVLADSK